MESLSPALQKIEKNGKIELRRAKAHLDKHSRTWDSNKGLMMGRIGKQKNGIAEAYGIFRSLVSNILASVPGAFFEAKKEEAREIAGFLTDAVAYDFTIGNVKDRFTKALWQNFPYGFGAIAENVETVHRRNEKGDVEGFGSQRFFWKNIPPRDLLFDPDGFNNDLSDHRFVFMAYYKTVRDIKESKTNDGKKDYFNLENLDQVPSANETTRGSDGRTGMVGGLTGADGPDDINQDFHQIRVWRWYDRVNETISDFLDSGHKLIRHEPWPMPIKIQGVLQFPVNLLAMNTESDDFYPIPECDLLRPQLINLIRLNDQLMTDLTDKIRKYIGLSEYLDPVKLGKLLDLKNPNKYMLTTNQDSMALNAGLPKISKAADALHKLEDVEADAQLPHGMAEVRAQMHNISAYGDAARGGLPQIRSAKEAARVSDQVNKSLVSRQSPLESMTAAMAMYHVLLLKYTAPDDAQRYFRVTDKLKGVKTWLSYCPKDIPSEEDLFCDVFSGSSTPQNLDGKKAQFLEEMRVMVPILQQERLSIMPLLYQYCTIFNVKQPDLLFKNQKGAAQEFLAATVKAAQMGKDAPPELLINAGMGVIDAVLDPQEKQAVIQAMQQQAQTAGPSGLEQGMSPMPQSMGTQDMGSGGPGA